MAGKKQCLIGTFYGVTWKKMVPILLAEMNSGVPRGGCWENVFSFVRL